MRVIGIDPGSRVCGYGVLELRGSEISHLKSGCIKTSKQNPLSLKLKTIYNGLVGVMQDYSPDVMSIEDIFFAKNAKSALKLGEARGVAILAASNTNIPVFEYAPTTVKLALTGRGRANKLEVKQMITRMLGVSEWETEDVSDAVAIALCHLSVSRVEKELGPQFVKTRKRRRFKLNDLPPTG